MPGIDSFNPIIYANSASARLATEKNRKEEETKKSKGVKNPFRALLQKAEETPITDPELPVEIATMSQDEAVAFLLDAVTLSGDELKKSPLPEQFAKYKKKISQFMHYVEKNTYDVEEQRGIRSRRSQKRYYLLKVIDEKLESLAKDVLFIQADQIKMLAKIDEINGLLVDFMT